VDEEEEREVGARGGLQPRHGTAPALPSRHQQPQAARRLEGDTRQQQRLHDRLAVDDARRLHEADMRIDAAHRDHVVDHVHGGEEADAHRARAMQPAQAPGSRSRRMHLRSLFNA